MDVDVESDRRACVSHLSLYCHRVDAAQGEMAAVGVAEIVERQPRFTARFRLALSAALSRPRTDTLRSPHTTQGSYSSGAFPWVSEISCYLAFYPNRVEHIDR